ncbi:MAG: helix-turn-helix domain-containing protein [Rubrivivax sp.]
MPLNALDAPNDAPAQAPGYSIHHLPVSGALGDCVNALIGVEMSAPGPVPFSVVPHDALVMTVQFGRSGFALEEKGEPGANTSLTGIREWTGTFAGAGNCITLFALLSPLGAVRLLDSRPLDDAPRIRASVAEMLDHGIARQLETGLALLDGVQGKLMGLANWLETRATAHRQQTRAALRAGRAAARLTAEPTLDVQTLADEQCVSRRQLERDFARWIGTSPRHLSQVARVQAVSRRALGGESLAGIAADIGFADQAHMSRVVRQLTGLPPRRFIQSQRTPMARAFRAATGGGTVYL